MTYQAFVSCAAGPLWWIQGEDVAVDMVRNQIVSQCSVESMTALSGSLISTHHL